MTSRRYALSLVSLLTATIVFAALGSRVRSEAKAADSQDRQRVGVAVVEAPYPLSEGKAEGQNKPFTFNRDAGALKATLLSSPMPDVWLAFPPDPNEAQSPNKPEPARTVKVSLPPEALESIRTFWSQALSFFYRDSIEKFPDARTMQEESVKFYNTFNHAANDLQKFQITTPSGTRNITHREGTDLITFVNRSAADLIKQAKDKLDN